MKRWERKVAAIGVIGALVFGLCSCNNETLWEVLELPEQDILNVSSDGEDSNVVESEIEALPPIAEILAAMTTEQKVNQMLQPAVYNITEYDMKNNDYGSILSHASFMDKSESGWMNTVTDWQQAALASEAGIPYVFGNDAVHGVNVCTDAVIFPHNIGIGAANDEELTYQMGAAVANEIKLTGMLWNFSPCLAVGEEPRWGRIYESYSSDPELVSTLGAAYTKGQVENGVVVCAKHYIGDGSVDYGTGEGDFLIDRGDASLDETELEALLDIYRAQIDAGAQSIMISHSSLNGDKMHGNKYMITDILKGELGFEGVVVSDWESIHNIPGDSYEQVVTAVNAGIDMLMEPDSYDETYQNILAGIQNGDISMERIDDAITRILQMKENAGLFKDPYQKEIKSDYPNMGSDACRVIARSLVEKSMVLLKNEGGALPIKNGSKIYVTGPAADDTGVLCGGWTYEWQGGMGKDFVKGGKTILDGFYELADEYNLTIITDPAQANDADITILCIGEQPYSEWLGDTEDMSVTGDLGLEGNLEAIDEAKNLGNLTVTLIVAGRNVIYDEYENDWNSIVMCYLPGSEGHGIANVLTGKSPFTGKLAMPYYSSVSDIENKKYKFEVGYGLTY